jgi:hypothetical protein
MRPLLPANCATERAVRPSRVFVTASGVASKPTTVTARLRTARGRRREAVVTGRRGQPFTPPPASTVEISFPQEQRMRRVGHWMLRMCPQAWHCR